MEECNIMSKSFKRSVSIEKTDRGDTIFRGPNKPTHWTNESEDSKEWETVIASRDHTVIGHGHIQEEADADAASKKEHFDNFYRDRGQ